MTLYLMKTSFTHLFSGVHWGSIWPGRLGSLDQFHREHRHPGCGRWFNCNKSQPHLQGGGGKGLQLSAAQSQSDWNGYRVNESVSQNQFTNQSFSWDNIHVIFGTYTQGVTSREQKPTLNSMLMFQWNVTAPCRCKMAQESGWGVMVSHRSGETEDTFIADLVVGLCTGQVTYRVTFRRLMNINICMHVISNISIHLHGIH